MVWGYFLFRQSIWKKTQLRIQTVFGRALSERTAISGYLFFTGCLNLTIKVMSAPLIFLISFFFTAK